MSHAPLNGWVWHKAFFKVGPGAAKTCPAFRRQAINLAICVRLEPEETAPCGPRYISLGYVTRMPGLLVTRARQPRLTTISRDVTHPTRSVTLTPSPAEVCPIYWIQPSMYLIVGYSWLWASPTGRVLKWGLASLQHKRYKQ